MNSAAKRAALKVVREAYSKAGQSPIITQSTLRLEKTISSQITTYDFSVLKGEGNPKPTEIRLDINDNFTAYQIGVFIAKAANASDTAFRLLSYPNPVVFPAAKAALNTLYNGLLQIEVNNKKFVEGWDLQRHYKAQRTQDSFDTAAPEAFDSFCGVEDGFEDVVPTITLSGTKKNTVEIVLPQAISTLEPNTDMRLVVLMRGFLAQNSSRFQGS